MTDNIKLHRHDHDDGSHILLYTLKQDGFRKRQPVMVHDLTICIENVNQSTNDLSAIADKILAAFNNS